MCLCSMSGIRDFYTFVKQTLLKFPHDNMIITMLSFIDTLVEKINVPYHSSAHLKSYPC